MHHFKRQSTGYWPWANARAPRHSHLIKMKIVKTVRRSQIDFLSKYSRKRFCWAPNKCTSECHLPYVLLFISQERYAILIIPKEPWKPRWPSTVFAMGLWNVFLFAICCGQINFREKTKQNKKNSNFALLVWNLGKTIYGLVDPINFASLFIKWALSVSRAEEIQSKSRVVGRFN